MNIEANAAIVGTPILNRMTLSLTFAKPSFHRRFASDLCHYDVRAADHVSQTRYYTALLLTCRWPCAVDSAAQSMVMYR
jgi:hypothetical protein